MYCNGRNDARPIGLSHNTDITLKTTMALYSHDRRSSSFFLPDLIVLLIMGLVFIYVLSPEQSTLKTRMQFFLNSWTGQNTTPHEDIGESLRVSVQMENHLIKEASPYLGIISDAAALNNVGKGLILAVIKTESGFNPGAVSSKGAMGLMQLMPATAMDLGVGNPFDPEENIRGGVAYLSHCLRRFGDLRLALAAYNAGPGLVSRLKRIPPYEETQNFVKTVLRHRAFYDAMELAPLGPRVG